MSNYKIVAKKILLQIRESFSGHPTRIITYLVLRLCESLVSWFVSAQILTMNIKRLPQDESLVHLLLKADLSTLVQFPKSLCSPQRTKRSRIHNESQTQNVSATKRAWCFCYVNCLRVFDNFTR